MVKMITEAIVDISANRNALMAEVDNKINGNLLSLLNDDFHDNKLYPIKINRTEINNLLNGIDARLRHMHELKIQFFDTLDHDFICGTSALTEYGANCTFTLPGTVINREFKTTDPSGYFEVTHTAFQDFILTVSSLLENLVRLNEMLIRKVILNSLKRAATPGNETFELYLDFLQALVKLHYRTNDDLHICMGNFDTFFKRYLKPLYKLRGSFIHGYNQNLVIDAANGICVIRRIDNSFDTFSNTEVMLDQFSEHIFDNVRNLTIDLLNCLTNKISDPAAHIPI